VKECGFQVGREVGVELFDQSDVFACLCTSGGGRCAKCWTGIQCDTHIAGY
jgi:hypothetical protein